MGYSIVKTPDGKLAIFSTIVDDIVVYDATPEEVTDFWVENAVERAKEEIARMLASVEERGRSGINSWDDVLRMSSRHPDDRDDKDFNRWLKRMKKAT